MTRTVDTSRRCAHVIVAAAGLAAAVGAALIAAPSDALGNQEAPDPAVAFWLITGAAGACLALSLVVIVAGWARPQPEVAILGSALASLSTLSLVHGLMVSGYMFAPNPATLAAATLAFPAAAAVGFPLLAPGTRPGRAFLEHWRPWCVVGVLASVAVGGILVASPGIALPGGAILRVSVALLIGAVATRFALRQVWLYRIGHRRASLSAAAAIGTIGLGALLGMLTASYSAGWWASRALDNLAVLAAGVALLVGYRQRRSIKAVLAPVVARDPLSALEVGLSPEVHAFVAALDRKDPSTRDHVIRTADLAMRVGTRARLDAEDLRVVGLGGLLHDIGKLVVPGDILTKPDRLTEAEFAAMKTHAERGALLLQHSLTLGAIAPVVRWHHERADATGYPDRLHGDQIPLTVAIVSVTDAWDAMTQTRHYRAAMSSDTALATMRDGAGSQWQSEAVGLLLEELEAAPAPSTTLDEVGRDSDAATVRAFVQPCLDALPPQVAAHWRNAARVSSEAPIDHEHSSRYVDLFEGAPFAYFSVSADGVVAVANAKAESLLQLPRSELVGTHVLDLYAPTPEGRDRAEVLLARFRAGEALRDEQLEMRRADGASIWVSLSVEPVLDERGRVVASRSVALDITAHRETLLVLRESEARFRRAFDDAPIGMCLLQRTGRFVRVNRALEHMTGLTATDLAARSLHEIVQPGDRPRVVELLDRASEGRAPASTELQLERARSAQDRHVLVSASAFQERGATCLLAHVQDITPRRRVEDRLRQLAFRDPLTGVYNRHGLRLLGQEAFARARRDGAVIELLVVDLDGLKAINDGFGHHAGDQALIEVADVLRACVHEGDIVARLGGDEFCVLVQRGPQTETDALAGRIEIAVEEHSRRAHHLWSLSVSIGTSRAAGHTRASIDDLLVDADRAMYARRADRHGAAI